MPAALLGALVLSAGCAPSPEPRGDTSAAHGDAGADPAQSATRPDEGAALAHGAAIAPIVARAQMRPVGDGTARGTIEFHLDSAGGLVVKVMMLGLAAGAHAVHLQTAADCAAAASARGESQEAEGGLGDVTAEASGIVHQTLQDTHASLDRGLIGRVVVVRARAEPLLARPNGGAMLACGVIETAGGRNVDSSGRPPRRLNA